MDEQDIIDIAYVAAMEASKIAIAEFRQKRPDIKLALDVAPEEYIGRNNPLNHRAITQPIEEAFIKAFIEAGGVRKTTVEFEMYVSEKVEKAIRAALNEPAAV